MARRPLPHARLVPASVLVLVMACEGCAAGGFGPVPGPAGPPGPLQRAPFRSGDATVRVTGQAQGRFHFKLEPSAIYVSPPPRLELAYGDPVTGEGLTIQIAPEIGTTLTSKFNVLALDVRLAGQEPLEATSMHGECSITLTKVGRGHTNGRFECRRLHQNMGPGPNVAASGTFNASA